MLLSVFYYKPDLIEYWLVPVVTWTTLTLAEQELANFLILKVIFIVACTTNIFVLVLVYVWRVYLLFDNSFTAYILQL